MMNKMFKASVYLPMYLFLGISTAQVNAAGIFKCVATDGKTYFIDKPCPVDNKETEFEAVKDPTNGYIPPEFVPDADTVQNSGVIIGKSSSDENEREAKFDEDEKVSLGQNGNNQSGGLGAGGEGPSDGDLDITPQRTENDKAFNLKLKRTSKDSKKGSGEERSNITILETSGEYE